MTYSPFGLGIAALGTSQASKFVTADASGDIIIPDDDKLEFGSSSDASIYWDTSGTDTLFIGTENVPITIGNSSNTTTIAGNLTVNGTTTTINSTVMTVDDLNLVLASGAADSSAANGAGITIDGASATLLYTHATTSWDMNKPLNVTGAGTFSGILKTDDTTDATSKTDGSLQTDGGLSVAKAIYNGTAATFAADSGIVTIGSSTAATFSAAGLLNINNATDATSATDGSLQTDGGLSVAKDAVIGNDLILLSDSAVVHFGASKEITLSHVADSGLTFKHTATADNKPITLTLATGEINMEADDVIGVINFQAPDEGAGTDAILIAAGIAAVSEGDFSSTNNATKLSFRTAASEAASEKMSLSSGGNLTVTGDIILDDGGSLKEAGGTAAFTFDGSGNVTKIGQDSPSSGEFLKFDGTNWVAATATVSGLAADDLSVGDAAVTLSTSSGNITIETQSSDTDIIFNVDDGGSQITALTLDGSDDGAAIFKSTIKGTVFKPAVEVVSSANVTISKGYTAISTAGSNRTATMPEATAALVGSTYTIKKTDSGSGNVVVTAEGDGLIDGGATVVLYHQFESVTVICRAADVWDII